jgi:hypothetical protein
MLKGRQPMSEHSGHKQRLASRPLLSRAVGGSAALAVLAAAGIALAPAAAQAATTGLAPGEGTGAAWCTTYGTDGAKGLYSYDNVWACGPDDTKGATPFDSNGTQSFQCVELSERFLWAIDGLAPIFGDDVDGATVVSLYHSAHPSIAVGSPGPSSLPQPGDVISFGGGGEIDPSTGHTAVVVGAPNSSGNFTIMSENWGNTAGEETVHIDMTGAHNGYVQFSGDSFWNSASFLELKPAITNGSFITYNGYVFRIVGGAPLYVSNWADVGGNQPTIPVTLAQFDALRQYPANGTAVAVGNPGTGHGDGFVFAGGAPLAVTNWANVGTPAWTVVDGTSLDNYSAAFPYGHVRRYPANGTAVAVGNPGAGHGDGFVFAGGAPLAVTNWANVGTPAWTVVDGNALDNYTTGGPYQPYSHVLQYPANGTAVAVGNPGSNHGNGYVFAGGAPLAVQNWANVGNPQWTVVDNAALFNYTSGGPYQPYSHVLPVPAAGTFLTTKAGADYRVAGGYAFTLSSCAALGGCTSPVLVDPWAIANPSLPSAHLNVTPANGTVVEGLPSATYWSFASGKRAKVGTTPSATAVNDSSLKGFPIG